MPRPKRTTGRKERKKRNSMVKEFPELDQWHPRRAEWTEWREALGKRAKRKKKEEAEEEEVDTLEVFFFHVYEFLSPTTDSIVNIVQADDEVVPVHLVPIDPINFVVASSPVSASSISL